MPIPGSNQGLNQALEDFLCFNALQTSLKFTITLAFLCKLQVHY